jgi:collagen type III alpha
MASPTLPPPEAPQKTPPTSRTATIDKRIRQTRRQLKLNDFATGSLALVAGLLGYLLVATLADHWLISGGLGFWSRLILFLGLVGGAGWYCFRVLFPPLIYQVNPIYAARTLEQARPSLKNSLINLLLLRREEKTDHENPLAERVIEGLQSTTASELDQIPAEVAIDRIHLIRRGYVLVALVALAAFYLVLSPKNPMPSFGRVLWPWARIAAPSRVQIEQIQPGDATVFQGRTVTVSALVEGLRAGEEVLLRYSTEDSQLVDQAVPMTPGERPGQFECQIPPTKAGLQQSLRYHLVAGDCVTFDYKLEMEVPPTIVVDSVHYAYPPYTGLGERTVTDAADIRAIEGTRITLQATANRDIQWAGIEMDGQASQRIRMRADGRQAHGQFTLKLGEDGETSQRWYQIRFAESETAENRENLDPVRHRIEVFADRVPQVRLIDPPPDNATVPLDGLAELKIEASDPDFALSRVAFLAERDGRPLPIPMLLDRTDTKRGYEGEFQTTYRFEPSKLGLRVGDEVQYLAVAEDTRQPQRNRSETDPRWLKIGPPERSDPQQSEPPSENGTPQEQQQRPGEAPQDPTDPGDSTKPEEPEMGPEQGEPNQTGEEGGEGAQSEEQQSDESGEGESAEQSDQPSEDGSPEDGENQEGGEEKQENGEAGQEGEKGSGPRDEPVNGETNAGDVFEEALKQLEKEKQENGADQPENGGEQPESGDQPGENSEPKPGEDTKSGEGDPAGKPQAGEQSENAQEHEGDSDVPPNRSEQGGSEGDGEATEPPQDMGGQGGQPDGTSPDDSTAQSPETESDAGGGKPTGKPGQGETSEDAETVDGGKAKPEDLENADAESIERKPGDPGDGKEPDHSQKPQPGSPEAGEPMDGEPTQKPEDAQPTPMPQETNQPNAEKPTGSKPTEQQPQSEATSPSTSKEQADQEQREPSDGDKSGDGGEGGGQDSDREGLGNPGSSTPDEEGGAPGGEQGEGETGPGAGDKVPTDQSTGNQAKQPGGQGEGEGAPQGESPGEKPQDNPQMPSGQQPPPQAPNDASGGTQGSDPSQRGDTDPQDRQSGGGTGTGPSADATNQPLGAEAANKEFAEKATDLALEYLEDELNKAEPNQEMLDNLGWKRQDLEEFVRRWQKMKAGAKEAGPEKDNARQELDDELKSLGLRPSGTSMKGGQIKTDSIHKTESIRSPPPPQYRELYQEYNKSIGSGLE